MFLLSAPSVSLKSSIADDPLSKAKSSLGERRERERKGERRSERGRERERERERER